MNRRLGSGIGLAALTLILASGIVACGDDGDGNPTPLEDINGVWDFTWTNTVATGICSDEVGEVSTGVITIVEDTPVAIGSTVTMTGFEGSDANFVTGSVASGNLIVVQGSYPEGAGTTTTHYELESVSATRMQGVEDWSYSSGVGDCPNSKATVVAVLRVP